MEKIIDKEIIVLYHGHCPDGFTAAWSAWKKFGDSAEYISVTLGTPPDPNLVRKEVYMLDFTYSEEQTAELVKNNKRVTSIDHHQTSSKASELTYEPSFDLNHSGAVLAWRYFHPDEPAPKFLAYIEDYDLWRFKLPNTKEFRIYISLFDFDFKIWEKIIASFEDENNHTEIFKQGKLLLRHEDILVNDIVKNHAEEVVFEGYKAQAVNSPVFADQIANILYDKLPPLGIVWYRNAKRLKFSLRSDGSADVSQMAQKYGGGGHKGSAGFSLPLGSDLPWDKSK